MKKQNDKNGERRMKALAEKNIVILLLSLSLSFLFLRKNSIAKSKRYISLFASFRALF